MTIACRLGSGGVGRIMAGTLTIDASGDQKKMMFEEDWTWWENGQGENFSLSVAELPLPRFVGVRSEDGREGMAHPRYTV